ncbi:MAG TPA: MFS transporter [Streptosporangiaceae bacterium]|jgi:MFS family permease|nr:MFS transporter [Streptosporangiaceae bacterium]
MMTATVHGAPERPAAGLMAHGLWRRQLSHYPDTGPRVFYLGIVVVATVVLYYQLYVPGAVSPAIIDHYHMTFSYYVYIIVIGNAVGAFGSLAAGLADRWGRANLVAYGLLVTGLLVLFWLPNAPSKLVFGIGYAAVAVVEGIILVATPALVRDFSPQLGRASAMGFWTLGPVVGSLVLALVSSHTLSHLGAWQDQFIICGIVGLAVAAVALVGLRELSPALRDQLMVSMRDRALIEARAEGIDIQESLRHPWRQMLHADIIGSAFAIAVFLIIYYTAVGFFTVYFTTIFGFSLAGANGIGNWFWAFDAGALIVVGVISDIVKVRKPFMVLGAVGAIVMTVIFGSLAGHPHTGYYTFVLVISLLSVFLAIAYAPWMASFTETVERRNPALTATGLAVWGWIIRAVIALSILVMPFVVSSMTPLVTYGGQVAALSARYAPELATAKAIDPVTQAALSANPANAAAAARAVGEVARAEGVSPAVAVAKLTALVRVPKADLAFLQAHGTQVADAAKAAPGQWRNWWWVCVGGEVVFIPLIFLMAGRWDPRRARQDAAAHEQRVQEELAALQT